LSSELCCKDQIRSNNNSALLDTTRSTHSDELPPMEIVTEDEPHTTALPTILLKKSNWVTDDTETLIQNNRGDDNCTTCRLCQQQFTTHRRLRVHVPQHFITTFCPCGEFSYHRDYILHHQRTMACYVGHLYDVDEHLFPTFLNIIKPCISDPSRYARLLQGFPSPGISLKDLVPLHTDTRRTPSLGHLPPSKLSLAQRHYPEWYFSGLRSYKSNSPALLVPLAPLVRDAGILLH